MGGMRMTGLISGMDTESMVKELVKANSVKVDKVKQDKQLLEWKKEAWQGLNTKLYDFYKNEVSALKFPSSFKAMKAVSSNESKVTVNGGTSGANGVHTISVKQLASSAYLTGANIKATGKTFDAATYAVNNTNFADMTAANGDNLNLKGQTITIKAGNDTVSPLTFELGGEGENGVANIEALNEKLKATAGYEKLKASYVDGKITFTNNSGKKDADGFLTGEVYNISSEALGIDGEVGYKEDEDAGKKKTLSGEKTLNYVREFSSADISKSTRLADIGIKVGTSFSIKGKDFVVDENTTISDFTSGLSRMGVNANFDAKQGRFYINATATGAEYDFNITSTDSAALDILGLSTAKGATKVDAQDAIINYNGVEYVNSSNSFEINGLTITAKGVTGTYDKITGSFVDDSPITVDVTSDTDSVYDTIKNFVKKYNELIDEMNKLYYENKPDYEPLTDEEKSKLSDTQIEQWEKKAKVGLLRRDDTIGSLLSNMRNMLNNAITVIDKDGKEKKYTLASLGIVTGDYSERGKLHILGDKDDAAYASETNKLKETLTNSPEIFSQFFVGDSTNKGIGVQMSNYLNKAMARKDNASRSLTFYNDITLDKDIEDKDDEIDKWTEKLQKMEDKYYSQFGKMETAMAKMQQQQANLAALMGTGN